MAKSIITLYPAKSLAKTMIKNKQHPGFSECPACGSNGIKKLRQDYVQKDGRSEFVVPDLVYYQCPDCGEQFFMPGTVDKILSLSPDFNKRRTALLQAVEFNSKAEKVMEKPANYYTAKPKSAKQGKKKL